MFSIPRYKYHGNKHNTNTLIPYILRQSISYREVHNHVNRLQRVFWIMLCRDHQHRTSMARLEGKKTMSSSKKKMFLLPEKHYFSLNKPVFATKIKVSIQKHTVFATTKLFLLPNTVYFVCLLPLRLAIDVPLYIQAYFVGVTTCYCPHNSQGVGRGAGMGASTSRMGGYHATSTLFCSLLLR